MAVVAWLELLVGFLCWTWLMMHTGTSWPIAAIALPVTLAFGGWIGRSGAWDTLVRRDHDAAP